MLSDTDYQRALAVILKHEGSAYNPDDPTGGSKYGVLQATYADWLKKNKLPWKNIRDITPAEAANLYRTEYWLSSGAPNLPYDLAVVHFDAAVNMGVGAAKQILADSGNTVDGYVAARIAKYKAIAAANPAKAKYLTAWIRRASGFLSSPLGKATGGLAVLTLIVVGAFLLTKR